MRTKELAIFNKKKEIFLDGTKKYQESLLSIGKPVNTHIYDLDKVKLNKHRKTKEVKFLIRVLEFYEKLSLDEKYFFLAEGIERDSYYRFWYLRNPHYKNLFFVFLDNMSVIDGFNKEVLLKYA